MMISPITKPKISDDYSYVLKTSQLEAILKDNEIKTEVILVYWKPQEIGSIFEVSYLQPNKNNHNNRLYIRAGAVLTTNVQSARAALLKEVLPEFVKWIKNIEHLEKSALLYTEQYFNAYYQNNNILIVKE